MGTVRDIRATPEDVVLDIDAELRFWRGSYREMPFHRDPHQFDDYIPTLKFGYDLYLLHYHRDLDEILATLKPRYERCVPEWRRLDESLSEAIVRAIWVRMKSGRPWRRIAHAPFPLRTLSTIRMQ